MLYASQDLACGIPLDDVAAQACDSGAELHSVIRMLADMGAPLPRAAWLLTCLLLNRTKYGGIAR